MADPHITEAFARLPVYLGNHVLISMTALALGLAISLPLAILSLRRPILRGALLSATSVIQTIPGLALLALFYPLLLGLAALSERFFGVSFSALGFLPAVLALTLYSMLPVVRNTITGLMTVPAPVKEAAMGVGMTARQTMRLVELPLALPVIMAGVRTASVWVIGTATLSTPIGQTSLGNYIFTGLQTQNWVFVLFGCAAAAVLALLVDRLLGLVEHGIAHRKTRYVWTGAAALALLVLGAILPASFSPRSGLVIGGKTFTEQYVLARLIYKRLGEAGLDASVRTGLGSAVVFNALQAGEIDVYVDYSGTIWANQMGRSDSKPRETVLEEIATWLKTTHNVTLVGALGFENAYALAMKRSKAEAHGIKDLSDLSAHAAGLTIAGDYEFFGRPEWAAVRDSYGLRFQSQRQMQAEFMYDAAYSGEVDVISAFSSEGRIAKLDLVTLDDPRQAIPPYDAVVLVSPQRGEDQKFLETLRSLVGKINIEMMRAANLKVSEGDTPEQAALWLDEKISPKN